MTALDVANAIRSQNLDAPAGQIGQPPAARGQSFQLPIDTLGRLSEPEQFGDIIVKVSPASAPARATGSRRAVVARDRADDDVGVANRPRCGQQRDCTEHEYGEHCVDWFADAGE